MRRPRATRGTASGDVRSAALSILAGLVALACRASDPEDFVLEAGAASQRQALRGGPLQLFLNRCPGGCVINVGPTDAQLNRSPIPTRTSTLPAAQLTHDEWDELHRCLYDQFADFDLVLVDREPSLGPYLEAAIGGRPSDLGINRAITGVSPLDCGLIDRGLNFTFAEEIGRREDAAHLCGVVAHEVGHTIGLEHLYYAPDHMSYLDFHLGKAFTRVDAECGEYRARPCRCGSGELQNSVVRLHQELGPRSTRPDLPPRIRLVTPNDFLINVFGDEDVPVQPEVEPAFPIVVDATDREGRVTLLEVRVDGVLIGAGTEPPFVFQAPEGLALGLHLVEARGFDERGQRSISTATVAMRSFVPPHDGGFFDAAGPRPPRNAGADAEPEPALGQPLPPPRASSGCRCLLGRPPSWAWLLACGWWWTRRRR